MAGWKVLAMLWISAEWVTTNGPNGQQTLVVTVRDSANATGTSSVTVTVQNP